MPTETSRPRGWSKPIVDIVCVLLAVLVAKTALAEPYYVPSGSMEPTLLIGDELLATKYAYGYSSASLPAPLVCRRRDVFRRRCPQRGDVVVFRWPGDRSAVLGQACDRIARRSHRGARRPGLDQRNTGRHARPDGISSAEVEDGAEIPAARYVETLPGGREHAIFKLFAQRATRRHGRGRRPGRHTCLSWATIATIPPTAAFRSVTAAWVSCRLRISSGGPKRSSARSILARKISQSGHGRPRCGCRGSSPSELKYSSHDARDAVSPAARRRDMTFQITPRRQFCPK